MYTDRLGLLEGDVSSGSNGQQVLEPVDDHVGHGRYSRVPDSEAHRRQTSHTLKKTKQIPFTYSSLFYDTLYLKCTSIEI